MPVLSDFIGTWSLSRDIQDAKYGQNGQMTGQACLTASDSGLLYHETGALVLTGGMQMQAERRYIWDSAGAEIAVHFDDGRDFHHFDPAGVAVGTSHLCGADLYNVTYDFTQWPQWSATWIVTGPRKDYTSLTRYNPT
jgi:hypothetical protein